MQLVLEPRWALHFFSFCLNRSIAQVAEAWVLMMKQQ